ncbi:TPA: type A2 lantipeptide [Streptococcus pyogenes]|nr:type A2 lantipeptide [Streptococcus pyogenes]
MSSMKNSKDILTNAIEEVSEKELMEVAGGKKGSGWFATITDDCPNSVFVCC